MLFADPPLDAVWSEVAEHAAQLAEIAMSAATPVPEPPLEAEDTTGVLVDLGFDDLDHPVREIANAACKLVLDLVRDPENRPAVEERIEARLAMSDDAKLESTLALLCGALDVDAGWTGSFAEKVTQLAHDTTSGIVTAHAEALLLAFDRRLPSRRPQPLPMIYKLRLPPAPMPGVGATGKPRRGQPLDDTDDPTELAGIVEVPLAIVARTSGVPLQNLTSRLAALMPDVAPRACWDRAAEKRLQLDLDSAGLKIAYRRPRTAIACLAFGRVVQELADAGVLPWPAPGVEQWLSAFDPIVSPLDASVRPAWCEAPDPAAMNSWSDKGWVDRPRDCLANVPAAAAGRLPCPGRADGVGKNRQRPSHRGPGDTGRASRVSLDRQGGTISRLLPTVPASCVRRRIPDDVAAGSHRPTLAGAGGRRLAPAAVPRDLPCDRVRAGLEALRRWAVRLG